jgi:hypothetical protein
MVWCPVQWTLHGLEVRDCEAESCMLCHRHRARRHMTRGVVQAASKSKMAGVLIQLFLHFIYYGLKLFCVKFKITKMNLISVLRRLSAFLKKLSVADAIYDFIFRRDFPVLMKIRRVKGKGHQSQCFVTLLYNLNHHQKKLKYQRKIIISVILNHCVCLYIYIAKILNFTFN